MGTVQYILGLDYGNARIGVAVASAIARLPRPLTAIANDETTFAHVRKLVADEHAGLVIVGLPRTLSGGYSQQTHAAEQFAHQLAAVLTVPVELADETLTSVDAEAALAGKKHSKGDIDALAAAYILERYLAEHPAEVQA
ncbi:MAG TPA: Holliday junction resolvase RuvX [Candidatus Saccharimonadales bacterium]|nr:Holliday junction resolvase RuvX [Candidatus Saccharimonadales bacterium]